MSQRSHIEVGGWGARHSDLMMDLLLVGRYQAFIEQAIKRMDMGASKSWGSERWLSSKAYRNQASGSTDNPLGLDTSLCSYSAGAGPGLFSTLPQLLYAPGISVIGSIGYEPEIFQSGLEGRPVRRDRVETDIGRILDQLL